MEVYENSSDEVTLGIVIKVNYVQTTSYPESGVDSYTALILCPFSVSVCDLSLLTTCKVQTSDLDRNVH